MMETLFVSSTFQDLLFERDAIRDLVLPRLNEEAQKYGQSVAVCDLRWGINTQDLDSETANRRVLDICLYEIAQSTSPMIVVLGERYGWIPPAELIRSAAERNQLRLNDLSLSVTALEIEYGMSIHRENTLFYFRELQNAPTDEKYLPEDSDHQKKQEALKAKIVRQAGDRVRTFRVRFDGAEVCQEDIRQFVDMVYEDVCRIMKPRWSRHRRGTPEEQEQERHWTYFREKSQMFLARLEQANQIVQKVLDGVRSVSIKGIPGSGKSTLLSKIAVILSEHNMTVIPVACGLTEASSTAMGVLRLVVAGMELKLKLPHKIEKDNRDVKLWRSRLNELCAMFDDRGQKLVVMVDAVDQLAQDEDRDNMIFLPDNRQAQVIVSSLPHITYQGEQDIPLPPIGDVDKKAVIRRMLEHHHRDLADQVIGELTEKGSSDTPLYLSLMLQRLMMMSQTDFDQINRRGGGMDEISRYQIEMIRDAPESLEEMSAELMRVAGDKIDGELVGRVNEYIAVSRYGLRESDLALLLGDSWNYLAFRQMLNYMRESYMRRDDGRYDFTHQSIRRGIQRACKDQAHRHHEIWFALHKLDAHDPVRISELIYHCMRATQVNNQKYFVSHINYFNEDDAVLKGAAGCVHAVSLMDGGKWMSELFENAEQYGNEKRLICFFDQYCEKLFSISYYDCEIKLRIHMQESRLLDRLVAAGHKDLAKTKMERYLTCALEAKVAHDNSREMYREKYFLFGKKLYQEGGLDDRQMWTVYSEAVSITRGESNPASLRRGVEIAEEALSSGLFDKLLAGNIDNLSGTPSFFDFLGETYARLGEPEKSLKAYKKNLELRSKFAEKWPSAQAFYGIGGECYNIGTSLYSLQRFEEARSYYEKSVELTEKYQEEVKKIESEILDLQNRFMLYLNYSSVLFIIGHDSDRLDLVALAFEYNKKGLRLCKRYDRERKGLSEGISNFPDRVGAMAAWLANRDSAHRTVYLSELYELFEEFLAVDEGMLKMEVSTENVNQLVKDYKALFHALKSIPDISTTLKKYQDRCRNSLLQHADNQIEKAGKIEGPEGNHALAQGYYEKSIMLLLLEEEPFVSEALNFAVMAAQQMVQLEQYENSNPGAFWALEAKIFNHVGICYTQVKDNTRAIPYFKNAVARQALAANWTSNQKDKLLLVQYNAEYEKAIQSISAISLQKASNPQRQPIPKNASITEKSKRQAPAPEQQKPQKLETVQNADGTQTVTYQDGSKYTGQWKDGQREGFGEIVFPSGASYRGEWKADKMCGYGVRTDIYGKETYGLWDEGTLVKPVSKMKISWILRKYKH